MDAFEIDPLTAQPAPTAPVPDVMLLAAGLGTRMRPLTFETPKALIEVAGKPLIDHAIDAAIAEGCTRFAVNAHHKADQVAAHVARLQSALPDLAFAVSHEKDRLLDTGGGLKRALPLLETDPVLALNTDTFWVPYADTPIARMAQAYADGEADIVLLCVTPEKATGFWKGPDFLYAEDGTLSAKLGRPVVYAGAALIGRDIAASGPDIPFSLYAHFAAARDKGRLKGVMIEAPWFHVGDPNAIARTEQVIGAAL
ncbi:nucleotidyltransferase family protein [Pelagibacterium xiamenense]|uniref:nucleotidyltransferase family protein n=1 Tax=Pelagibacterium xiamenense TaxID=2901140 RepID=UPI001E463F06|nr:nucleotidyltransferase family protein [Pelagibacterium xiamenense]MCD7058584.1 nucleotidyltransferase family protein [Pelagibacterium xiamenense]